MSQLPQVRPVVIDFTRVIQPKINPKYGECIMQWNLLGCDDHDFDQDNVLLYVLLCLLCEEHDKGRPYIICVNEHDVVFSTLKWLKKIKEVFPIPIFIKSFDVWNSDEGEVKQLKAELFECFRRTKTGYSVRKLEKFCKKHGVTLPKNSSFARRLAGYS